MLDSNNRGHGSSIRRPSQATYEDFSDALSRKDMTKYTTTSAGDFVTSGGRTDGHSKNLLLAAEEMFFD